MTPQEMTELQKALYSATKVAKAMKVPVCSRVENDDGVAVFYGETGNVLGAMNWEDYIALCDSMAKKPCPFGMESCGAGKGLCPGCGAKLDGELKSGQAATVQKGKT